MSIAYATLDHLLKHIQCRTLFATHYHELATMLMNPETGRIRQGVDFFCTDVNEGVRHYLKTCLGPMMLIIRMGLLAICTSSGLVSILILMLSSVSFHPLDRADIDRKLRNWLVCQNHSSPQRKISWPSYRLRSQHDDAHPPLCPSIHSSTVCTITITTNA